MHPVPPLERERIAAVLHQLRSVANWQPIRVADVGVSGGLSPRWTVLGDELRAVGFDPLLPEIARLQEAETRPHVSYVAAHVGRRHKTDGLQPRGIQPYQRSTAQQVSASYIRDHYNAGAAIEYVDRLITLDEYFANQPAPHVLKIDTDGSDYDVLRGAERTLANILCVDVEAQFHGPIHPDANVFRTIDAFLVERGFQLFDLRPHRYSRAALPAPFEYDQPASTISGQVGFADAVYMRDLAAPEFPALVPGFDVSPERLLVLCALFVLYELPDCAAEVLTTHAALRDLAETPAILDGLTPTGHYADYLAMFTRDPRAWYASRRETGPRSSKQLLGRVANLEARNEQLRARNEELTKRLRSIKAKLQHAREKAAQRGM